VWRASIICLVVVHTRQELKLLQLLLSVGWLKNQHATSSLDSTMGRATPESGSSAHTSSCCTPSGYTAAFAPTPSPSSPPCYCSRAGRRVGAPPHTTGSTSDLRYGSAGGYSACYPATEEGRHSQMFRQISRFYIIIRDVGFRPVSKMLILPNAVVTIYATCFALLSFRNEVSLCFLCCGNWIVWLDSWLVRVYFIRRKKLSRERHKYSKRVQSTNKV